MLVSLPSFLCFLVIIGLSLLVEARIEHLSVIGAPNRVESVDINPLSRVSISSDKSTYTDTFTKPDDYAGSIFYDTTNNTPVTSFTISTNFNYTCVHSQISLRICMSEYVPGYGTQTFSMKCFNWVDFPGCVNIDNIIVLNEFSYTPEGPVASVAVFLDTTFYDGSNAEGLKMVKNIMFSINNSIELTKPLNILQPYNHSKYLAEISRDIHLETLTQNGTSISFVEKQEYIDRVHSDFTSYFLCNPAYDSYILRTNSTETREEFCIGLILNSNNFRTYFNAFDVLLYNDITIFRSTFAKYLTDFPHFGRRIGSSYHDGKLFTSFQHIQYGLSGRATNSIYMSEISKDGTSSIVLLDAKQAVFASNHYNRMTTYIGLTNENTIVTCFMRDLAQFTGSNEDLCRVVVKIEPDIEVNPLFSVKYVPIGDERARVVTLITMSPTSRTLIQLDSFLTTYQCIHPNLENTTEDGDTRVIYDADGSICDFQGSAMIKDKATNKPVVFGLDHEHNFFGFYNDETRSPTLIQTIMPKNGLDVDRDNSTVMYTTELFMNQLRRYVEYDMSQYTQLETGLADSHLVFTPSNDAESLFCGFQHSYDMDVLKNGLSGLYPLDIAGHLVLIWTPDRIRVSFVFNEYLKDKYANLETDKNYTGREVQFPLLDISTIDIDDVDSLFLIFSEVHMMEYEYDKDEGYPGVAESLHAISFSTFHRITGESNTYVFPLSMLNTHMKELAYRYFVEDITIENESEWTKSLENLRYNDSRFKNAPETFNVKWFDSCTSPAKASPRIFFIDSAQKDVDLIKGIPYLNRSSLKSYFVMNMNTYSMTVLSSFTKQSRSIPEENQSGHFIYLDTVMNDDQQYMVGFDTYETRKGLKDIEYMSYDSTCVQGFERVSLSPFKWLCQPISGVSSTSNDDNDVEEVSVQSTSSSASCPSNKVCIRGSDIPIDPTEFPTVDPSSSEPSTFVSLTAAADSDAESIITDMFGQLLVDNIVLFSLVVLVIGILAVRVRSFRVLFRQVDVFSHGDHTPDGRRKVYTLTGMFSVIAISLGVLLVMKSFRFTMSYNADEARIFNGRHEFGENTWRDCRLSHSSGIDDSELNTLGELKFKMNLVSYESCHALGQMLLSNNGSFTYDMSNCSVIDSTSGAKLDCNTVIKYGIESLSTTVINTMSTESRICELDFGTYLKAGAHHLITGATDINVEDLNDLYYPVSLEALSNQIVFNLHGLFTPVATFHFGYSNVDGTDSVLQMTTPYGDNTPIRGNNTTFDINIWRVRISEHSSNSSSVRHLPTLSYNTVYDNSSYPLASYEETSFVFNLDISENLISCVHQPIVEFSSLFLTLFIVMFSVYELMEVFVALVLTVRKYSRPLWSKVEKKSKKKSNQTNSNNPYSTISGSIVDVDESINQSAAIPLI